MAFSPPSLLELRKQADARYPGRSTASDGWLGDAAHRTRRSDHNPDANGCVHARDLTNDPSRGFDAHRWARQVAERGDERVAYLISAGQIWNPTASAWQTYTRLRTEGHSPADAARMALPGWRTYTGPNPHNTHAHVSIKHTDRARNDTSSWFTTHVSPEVLMARIAGAVGFAVMHNDDIVITDRSGAIYHFDADGVPDATDFAGSYANPANSHLWGGPSPTSARECIGIYPINQARRAVPNGDPGAVGYCQVFDDIPPARYHWVR